jgi:membrane-bound lytic murein transglycosylase D
MLPRETSRFAPRYIAVLMIIQNPDKYGFQLPEPDPPIEFDTITVNKPMRLSDLDLKLSLQPGTLANLNPELRHKATPGQEYQLKIPRESGDQVLAAVDAMSKYTPPEASYVIHYVRRGETVSGIARRYRTSISSIARLNRLRRNFLIRPGQRLKIPSRGRRISSYSPPSAPKRYIKHGEKISYRVKRGDSLYSIASRFHTTVQQIKKSNQLASNILSVGQELVLESVVPSGVTVYVVKSGDTPYTISQRFSMGLTQLLSLNRLTRRSRIYPGQQLWVIEKKN